MKTALLIPFYNEEAQIPLTLAAVVPIMESTGLDFEILMIDDGSKDNTWPVIEDTCRRDPRLTGLRFSRNFGKEAAICAALDEVNADAVILMDGDLQHPPQHIPEMIRLWQEGYEIVEGIKSSRGKERLSSKINATVFYGLFRRFSGIDLRDASDFKLLDRRVVEQWRHFDEHDTFFRGISAWMGFKRATFTFAVADRQAGSSKWSPIKLLALSLNAITSFSAMPLQFITFLGIMMLTGSLILGIQTLVNFFTGHSATGFTTVILLLLLIGGCIMISLGLIGIYIARIFTEVKGRPRYIIAQDTRKMKRMYTDQRKDP